MAVTTIAPNQSAPAIPSHRICRRHITSSSKAGSAAIARADCRGGARGSVRFDKGSTNKSAAAPAAPTAPAAWFPPARLKKKMYAYAVPDPTATRSKARQPRRHPVVSALRQSSAASGRTTSGTRLIWPTICSGVRVIIHRPRLRNSTIYRLWRTQRKRSVSRKLDSPLTRTAAGSARTRTRSIRSQPTAESGRESLRSTVAAERTGVPARR